MFFYLFKDDYFGGPDTIEPHRRVRVTRYLFLLPYHRRLDYGRIELPPDRT